MAELSEDDCLAISQYPLEPTIGHLRALLQIAIEQPSAGSQQTEASTSDDDKSDSTTADDDSDIKDSVLSLILALQGHRVARRLRLKDSGGIIAAELAKLYARLTSNAVEVEPILPLMRAVVQKESDVEIWKKALLLITETSQTTPPPSIGASFGGTPRTYSSASHEASEQTKTLLYNALRDEFTGCSYVQVPGFFEKYFENKSWTQKTKDIFKSISHLHSDGRWTTFPDRPIESAVWSWWSRFQEEHLKDTRGIYYTTKSKKDMTGLDSEGQLDIFVKSRKEPSSDPHDWAHVLVIGEHTVSPKHGEKFLQLARYARKIFLAQPRRQFLHGFILSETKMELHVFDRSGTYSAEPFDIHSKPECFIQVISGYCMMSDKELGLDTFIEREGVENYVTVVGEDKKDRRLQLDPRLIARTAAVVGRGTSCYPIQEQQGVVKISWASASRSPTEYDLLKSAKERGVRGVPRLIGYHRGVSTCDLRSPLVFSKKRHMEGRQWSLNRQRSNPSFSSQLASLPLSDEGKKRKSPSLEQNSSKKSRSNSPSKLSQVHEASNSYVESQVSQASQTANKPFVDRVLCIQATQPAGDALARFRSVPQLLRAFRDAIKVHRSLLLDGQILHRDVSESNIIITNPDENDGFSGMLIDLELGTILEDGKNTRTGLKRMTGTLKYMAIEMIELGLSGARPDLEHTYRHDLESFFYVFLSMCINYGWAAGKDPAHDPLRGWYIGSYDSIVRAKLGDMGVDGFERLILPKFSPPFECVKGLATSLRDILFLRHAKLRTGKPAGDESVLYDQMISAFNKAINSG